MSGESMFYREWTLKPDQRRGTMLPLKTVAQFCNAPDAGYASVYWFDEESARQILAARSSAGLARYPVYTDSLTIDLDQGTPQLRALEPKIEGLAYQTFESGGKGYHVVIPLDRIVSGKNVPYSQRKWVEALGVDADLSLYQAGHIVALPGRVHPRTGKRKTLATTREGASLSLPILDLPTPSFAVGNDDQGELERGLWRTLGLLQQGPGVGGRHMALWSTAKHYADAGIGVDAALELLWQVNQTWQDPKSLEEVRAAVSQAYRAPTI